MGKLLSEIPDLELIINDQIKQYGNYYRPSIRILNIKDNKPFLLHCEQFSENTYIDGLGGILKANSDNFFRRYPIPQKNLNDVIHKCEDCTGNAGIQITKFPIGTFSSWDVWEGGYILGHIRMRGDLPEFEEYFVFQYIRMKHLYDIINPFKEKLILL